MVGLVGSRRRALAKAVRTQGTGRRYRLTPTGSSQHQDEQA